MATKSKPCRKASKSDFKTFDMMPPKRVKIEVRRLGFIQKTVLALKSR
jgi:hypothetical protein